MRPQFKSVGNSAPTSDWFLFSSSVRDFNTAFIRFLKIALADMLPI
jgi:hypothetical protein